MGGPGMAGAENRAFHSAVPAMRRDIMARSIRIVVAPGMGTLRRPDSMPRGANLGRMWNVTYTRYAIVPTLGHSLFAFADSFSPIERLH